ncbi:MAG: YgeY family selenium metabolism-linked hydrolase [Bacteriovoracaceae bacterium]|nr:YgeY family selenium metabolism-linked hydrolase [Bacteriovoracaceae bacterium]
MDIKQRIENYRHDSINFMRDLIRIPGISCQERDVALRILREMKHLGFEHSWIDDYGNVIGKIGNGPIKLLFDSHIDTVDVGNLENWGFDPYDGKVEDGYIYGRGASDNHNGTVAQVFGAALFKEIGDLLDQFTIYVVGTVQEEDCDGLGLRYILEHSIGSVDYVCLGEATDMKVFRGHRGRMEISVTAKGVSCHGSAPLRGENAVYRMMPLISDIEKLNKKLKPDKFLGKGTCVVTHVSCETPSLCAVPDLCKIHIDRRLSNGEDKTLAVLQIEELASFDPKNMKVEILHYDAPSYQGKVLETEKYYPTWVLPEDHPLVKAGVDAASKVLGKKVTTSKWVFSTNGIASMGQLGIPTIGFGPASEVSAHSTDDKIKISDMINAIEFYAKLPESILKFHSTTVKKEAAFSF